MEYWSRRRHESKASHVPLVFNKMVPMMMPIIQRRTGLDGELCPIPRTALMCAFLGRFYSNYINEAQVNKAFPPKMMANAMDHFVDIFLHEGLVKETA